jgi:hypothetical protein
MGYALKMGGQVVPLTGEVDPQILLHGEGNTIMYEQNPRLREALFTMFTNCGCEPTAAAPDGTTGPAATAGAGGTRSLRQLLCCLPQVALPPSVTYDNVFRVIIMQFLDPHNFDVRSVKKSCVHIVHPDGRIIPFDTFNLFYRDGKGDRLTQLGMPQRRREEAAV